MKFVERYRALVGEAGSLRQRSLNAMIWSFGGTTVQRGLSLVSNLIMTRLLFPEAFGLMAMVVTVLSLVNMMSDIGIQQSIVRDERGGELHFMRVAWTVQILRSAAIASVVVILGLALSVLGPALASPDSVYADPRLPALICVSALAVLFRGLESTSMHLATRKLQLRKVTIIDIVNQIITIIIMVTLAQVAATVWVLLLGMLLGAGQRMVWTHLAFRTEPMRLTWDAEIAAEMWRFGRWLIGASAAGFVVNQGDRFLMGALLDAETFGLYVIATLWLQTGTTLLDTLFGKIIFSGFSETLRERRPRFPQLLARVRRWFDICLILAFMAAFFGGPLLIGLLYTPEYAASAGFLSLLSLRFLTQRQQPLTSFLLAEGESRLMAGSFSISAVAMVIGVPLAYRSLGTDAAIIVVALAPLAGAFLLIRKACSRLPELKTTGDAVWIAAVVFLAFVIALGRSS